MLSPIKRIFRRGEPDCKEVRRRSSGYLDKDLPAAKQSAIYAHLSKCGPCRAFIDTLASTIVILSRLPHVSTPPSFKQSILERTKRKGEKGLEG